MSNDITDNPLALDTASATAVTTKIFTVSKIRWVYEGAVAGDNVIITDNGGITKFETVASGANYVESETFEPPLVFAGLKATTLAGGKVYLYVASSIPIQT